jgi:hypothetical protein
VGGGRNLLTFKPSKPKIFTKKRILKIILIFDIGNFRIFILKFFLTKILVLAGGEADAWLVFLLTSMLMFIKQ